MLKVYLDTEFNGMGGELISLALVPEHGSGLQNWYGVVEHGVPVEWVQKHVVPHLDLPPVSIASFKGSLHGYLQDLPRPLTIIADWPDDFKYLCDFLVVGPGQCLLPTEFYMTFVDVKTEPKRPHNALSDAIALRDACNG